MVKKEMDKAKPSDVQTPEVERAHSGPTYTPSVDIIERKDAIVVVANVPGAEPGRIDVRFENGTLELRAPVEPETFEGCEQVLGEYRVGEYYRAFTIGEAIDAGGISAQCKNGVLTLTLPKSEEAKPRKIAVTAG